MKTISNDLKTHLASGSLTTAILWKLTRTDSTIMGFTDHDTNITYDGLTYESSSGYVPSDREQSMDMSVDNLDVMSFLDSALITEEDLIAGVYDGSTLDILMVNYEDLTMGAMILSGGWEFGRVEIKDTTFSFEIRSKTQKLQQHIGELTSPTCRAQLGDTRCGIDTGAIAVIGTVATVTSNSEFTVTIPSPDPDDEDGWYKYGKLTWTSGNNNGYDADVIGWTTSTQTATLFLAMIKDVEVGDAFSMFPGCDKSIATCKDKFDNVNDFRGEPYIPGNMAVLEYGNN